MIQQDRFSFFSVKMLVEESLVLQKKGCGRMDRRTKYRHLLWWIICLDLLTVIWLGYRYLDRKIPDELYVTESQEQQVKNVLGLSAAFFLMMQLRFPEMEVICYPAEFWE